MERDKAAAVVQQLNAWGVEAATISSGQYRAGVCVRVPGGGEARWGIDGTATLEAVVLRDGVLVGFVAPVPGSAAYGPEAIAWAIAKTDYQAPPLRDRAQVRLRPPPGAPAWAEDRRVSLSRRCMSRMMALLPRVS